MAHGLLMFAFTGSWSGKARYIARHGPSPARKRFSGDRVWRHHQRRWREFNLLSVSVVCSLVIRCRCLSVRLTLSLQKHRYTPSSHPVLLRLQRRAGVIVKGVYGRFPESHFPGKIVCHCFNVKQTLTVFCVNWRNILLTGLLSLIRDVMQRGPALLIFTLSALSGQVPAHHV